MNRLKIPRPVESTNSPLVLLLALFLLLANGRMDSGDANAELQGSLNLVNSGSFGTDSAYSDSEIQSLFVRGANGRYYESHDIGNSLMMIPAAWVGITAIKFLPGLNLKGVAGTYTDSSLIIAKTLCSISATAFSAIACFFLFRLFNLFLDNRTSMAMALLFPFGTYFSGYFRSCWDVVPACNALCISLYFLTKMYAAKQPSNSAPILAALWCGVACIFRYSLLPFLGLGMVLVFWASRSRFDRTSYLYSLIVASLVLLPTLIFNFIRMKSIFLPATMAPQFSAQNGLTLNIMSGAIGLLFSPNRGLFVFSPILLLLITFPWYRQVIPAPVRGVIACLAPGIALYFLMISGMRNWGAAGWGPRYLLPVFPAFFVPASFILAAVWTGNRASRASASIVLLLAFAVALPAIFVNYTAAISSDSMAIETTALLPHQIIDTTNYLVSALRGKSESIAASRSQEAIVTFPDLAVTRVFLLIKYKSAAFAYCFLMLYLFALGSTLHGLTRTQKTFETARVA